MLLRFDQFWFHLCRLRRFTWVVFCIVLLGSNRNLAAQGNGLPSILVPSAADSTTLLRPPVGDVSPISELRYQPTDDARIARFTSESDPIPMTQNPATTTFRPGNVASNPYATGTVPVVPAVPPSAFYQTPVPPVLSFRVPSTTTYYPPVAVPVPVTPQVTYRPSVTYVPTVTYSPVVGEPAQLPPLVQPVGPRPVVARTKYYVPGQPLRNMFKAITP